MAGPSRPLGLVLCFTLASAGCAQTVLFRTDQSDVRLVVDEVDRGPLPEEGLFVEVDAGASDVRYELVRDDKVIERGIIEREVRWLPLIGALTGAAICVPMCGLTCFGLANPLFFIAPAWALLGTTAGFGTVLASPGWLSLPCAFAGTLLGLTPLVSLLGALRVPTVLRVGVSEEADEERKRRRKRKKRKRKRKRRRPADEAPLDEPAPEGDAHDDVDGDDGQRRPRPEQTAMRF